MSYLNVVPQEVYDNICKFLNIEDYMCLFEAVKREMYRPSLMHIMVSERDLVEDYPDFMKRYNYANNVMRISIDFDAALLEPLPCTNDSCLCDHFKCLSAYSEASDKYCGCCKDMIQFVDYAKDAFSGMIRYGGCVIFYNVLHQTFNSNPLYVLQNYFNYVRFDEDSNSCLDKIIRRGMFKQILNYTEWNKELIDDRIAYYFIDDKVKLNMEVNVYTSSMTDENDLFEMIRNLVKPCNTTVWDYLVLPSVYKYKPLC
ncbi:hypothetical protein SlGVgp136 [Spodoptera litura granulovirus]|uniref:F-box domain-containing protein n=1 Tax=Spodoptera litura granulovirus TaxID=359919 RepID=A5IZY8_9BBAC|nr:hypothetical protein SlGVgp136 [Spodoptera litura granulovirus]ABQ52079.1 hypothetical protein SlGVgp136 [Spodoptera litura granulovirus]